MSVSYSPGAIHLWCEWALIGTLWRKQYRVVGHPTALLSVIFSDVSSFKETIKMVGFWFVVQ